MIRQSVDSYYIKLIKIKFFVKWITPQIICLGMLNFIDIN